ncbi:MAG TPA: hypothetical protein VGO13_05345 [Solirubrobacterales bacterium]|nr:hypothetical protein [Solirubrobacterales bacterium]
MPVTITAAQREALYTQVLDHLSGIGDLWLAIESREYEKAGTLGHAFADDLRLLLEDLGWPDHSDLPADGSVELTMPVEDLKRVIERLRDEASQLYADTLPRSGDDREVLHRTDLAVEACGRVLGAISRGGGAG